MRTRLSLVAWLRTRLLVRPWSNPCLARLLSIVFWVIFSFWFGAIVGLALYLGLLVK